MLGNVIGLVTRGGVGDSALLRLDGFVFFIGILLILVMLFSSTDLGFY